MKNRFFYFVILLLAVCLSANANDFKKKRKKQETTPALADALKKEKTEDKSYDKVITKEARTKKGLITLHMVKSTFYMEIPVKLMGKPMLFAGRVAEISDNKDVVAGQMPQDPMLVEWSCDEEKVYLHNVISRSVCDENEPIAISMERNNLKPVIRAFPIKAFSKDSSAMVIDATKLFCADERPVSPFIPASPFDALFGMKKMKGVFKADLSSILDFKAFPQNISVKSRVAYTVNGTPFTAVVHLSMIQLPDEPMRPRLLDPRMGYFSDRKVLYSTEKDQSEKIAASGVKYYIEVANMPTTNDALNFLRKQKGIIVAPSKAVNAGGVGVSALEMAQNSERLVWTAEEVDHQLHKMMENIHKVSAEAAAEYGLGYDLVAGANIAGFKKVAEAMMEQGCF